ncbi:hypothetical protein ACFWQJ_02100 [Kocuria palustris]|uniref:hypothetical protein n=1 Tax=Kocuria palustris TaxID=71999 RepID=UPI003651F63F
MPISTYPYGFLLRPRSAEVNGPDRYTDVEFADEYVFSHDPRRSAQHASTQDGTEIIVFGRCYDLSTAAPDQTHIAADLANTLTSSESEFLDRLDLLAGRWIVLAAQAGRLRLYHDAVGTRSVYFDADNRAAASHASLLGSIFDHEPSGVVKPSMTWDLSSHEGVRALLPNHRLEVTQGTIERYWPRRSNPWEQRSEVDRLDRVIELWHRQMEQVQQEGLPLRFALSGGLDSRTALALSTPYLARMQTFTYGASPTATPASAEVLNLDAEIVAPVAELLRLDHRVIRPQTPSPSLDQQTLDDVRSNSLTAHGRWLLPYYLQEFPDADSLVLRANAFEVGQHKWAEPSDADTAAAAQKRWVRFAHKSGVEIPGTDLMAHVQDAFRDQEILSVQHGYLASDLTHWEFRLGRWATEVFNEIDVAFEPFVPLSCRAILTPLLAFDREQRASQYAFRELINRAHPVLNFFGINDNQNLYEKVRTETSQLPHLQQIPPDGLLTLPLAKFQPGGSETAQVFAAPMSGHLSFDMETFWTNSSDDNSFEYQVQVDEQPVLTIEGQAPKGIRHVRVQNLRAHSSVALSIVARKGRSKPSWERATRALIRSIRFESGSPQGPVSAESWPDPGA